MLNREKYLDIMHILIIILCDEIIWFCAHIIKVLKILLWMLDEYPKETAAFERYFIYAHSVVDWSSYITSSLDSVIQLHNFFVSFSNIRFFNIWIEYQHVGSLFPYSSIPSFQFSCWFIQQCYVISTPVWILQNILAKYSLASLLKTKPRAKLTEELIFEKNI